MSETNFRMNEFNKAVLEGTATWWQMNLPSGEIFFGDAKTDMLGYSEKDFKHYSDFTNIIHPEDYEKAMTAMRNHLTGKNAVYETDYRIKNKNGKYIMFYDCGQIIKRDKLDITLIGFVMKIKDDKNIFEQMKQFKDLIISGNPSIIELVSNIKKN